MAIISNSSQTFGEGFRITANSTVTFNVIQDGIARLEDNLVLISTSGNQTVDVIESF